MKINLKIQKNIVWMGNPGIAQLEEQSTVEGIIRRHRWVNGSNPFPGTLL